MTISLLVATTSAAKAAEIQAIFRNRSDIPDIRLLTLADLPSPAPAVDETGATFAENALLKARALAAWFGIPALADDSGLCVDALDGAPGLYSARWAGADASDADRVQLLLEHLSGISLEKRTARFVCAVALSLPSGRSLASEGVCEGSITEEPRGSGGFGYDPIFYLRDQALTLAQLTPSQKNHLSHRARALSLLAPQLSHFFDEI